MAFKPDIYNNTFVSGHGYVPTWEADRIKRAREDEQKVADELAEQFKVWLKAQGKIPDGDEKM